MTAPFAPSIPPRYLSYVNELLQDGKRRFLGLAGAPGAGKSTLAEALLQAFPGVSQLVSMDGFHLANVELQRLGRAERKGAWDTFDGAGYVALLKRLRQQAAGEVVYAPELRREIDEPVANAVPIFPDTRLVITEGNYLLLNLAPWTSVAALLDEIWYVDVNPEVRKQRLAQRHERFGRTPQAALDWVYRTDEPNARLVERTRPGATREFRWDADS